MTIPMSTLFERLLTKAEIVSSFLIALDDMLRFGEITRAEHTSANRILGKWMNENPELADMSFSQRKLSFKTLLKGMRKNECMHVR